MKPGLFLHGGSIALQFCRRKSPVPHCRNHLPQRFDTYIARGIQSLAACLQQTVCHNITALVALCDSSHQIRCRLISGKDKDSEILPCRRPVFRDLSRNVIPIAQTFKHTFSRRLDRFRIREHSDLFMAQRRLRSRRRAFESVPPDQDCHVARIFRQEYALLGSRKSAADHKDISSGKKFSITGSTVSDPSSTEFLFPLKSYLAGMSSGGQQHAEAGQLTAAGLYFFYIA